MRARLAAEQEPTLYASLANIAEVVVLIEGLKREARRPSVSLLGCPQGSLTDMKALRGRLVRIDAEGASAVPEVAAGGLGRHFHHRGHCSSRAAEADARVLLQLLIWHSQR